MALKKEGRAKRREESCRAISTNFLTLLPLSRLKLNGAGTGR